jgi:hypothetical protein
VTIKLVRTPSAFQDRGIARAFAWGGSRQGGAAAGSGAAERREEQSVARAHLFTQAYGVDAFRLQALYLAWSAVAWRERSEVAVHVYTDAPALFEPLSGEIEVRAMSPQDIRRWRGPGDFTHRLKALLVQDMSRRFPSDPLLYLDADTYLVAPPEGLLARIGPGRSVMHAREDHLGRRDDYHMQNFSRRLRRLSFRGGPIDLDRWMWNAGAIGIDPSIFPVIEDWIAFIDEVWPRYRRGLVEQYGIAMLLQRAGQVTACDDLVVHYWFQKGDYTAATGREVEVLRSRPLGEAIAHLRAHPIRIPYREMPRVRQPFWSKWSRSLFGER